MNQRYRLPLAAGRALLQDGHLIPLLDGLDELPQPHLAPCVDAIQSWAQTGFRRVQS
jgi:predicted NACHT family NTPase